MALRSGFPSMALVVAGLLTFCAMPAIGQSLAQQSRPSQAGERAATDLSGQWQGTFGRFRTVILVIRRGADYKGALYSIDQPGGKAPIESMSVSGKTVRFTIPSLSGNYEGELSPDSQTIRGTFTQNGRGQPVELARSTPATAWAVDPSPHTIRFVTTQDKVRLEVLDWGGRGRSLLFIAGLGADAHVFDTFAPRFTGKHHVYAVTRRGYGVSDHPDPAAGADYSADRLGDDVRAVMDALKLDKPVLAGWSLGGEEISSIISRFPQRVSGAIYLDAAYGYSFYQTGNVAPDVIVNLAIDSNDIGQKVRRLQASDLPTADAAARLAAIRFR